MKALSFANSLVKKYGTNNPFELCKILDISIIHFDLPTSVKGFYTTILGQKFIYLNNCLDTNQQRVVAAHELGHAVMHSDSNFVFLTMHTNFCMGKYEKEADSFCGCLLLRDAFNSNESTSISEISTCYGIPPDIVELAYSEYKEQKEVIPLSKA